MALLRIGIQIGCKILDLGYETPKFVRVPELQLIRLN